MDRKPSLDDVFDRRLLLPDPDAQQRLARLVGIDEQKARLSKTLGILINSENLRRWAADHHPGADLLLDAVLRRPPLVVLAGDVGTGKTELAETIGDMTARQEKLQITVFPLSLATRGSGRVGEMTRLISAAFELSFEEAKKFQGSAKARAGVVLLIDEADALAQSRENAQMHHEDRAGVNALIRGIDRLSEARLPAVVIMCTNRLDALDPAVRRRAAELLLFHRPRDEQRHAVLEGPLAQIGFTKEQIGQIVRVTGESNGQVGYTYSDLTQRYLPRVVLDAYPASPILFRRALQIAKELGPTPPFGQQSLKGSGARLQITGEKGK